MNTILKTLRLLVLPLIFLTSCNNNVLVYLPDSKDTIEDFRDKYVGKYQTIETIVFCCIICNDTSQRDTVIIVNYGSTDSTLQVLGRDIYLDSNGWYKFKSYNIRLWNDSIYYLNSVAHGCFKITKYEGYKISNNP